MTINFEKYHLTSIYTEDIAKFDASCHGNELLKEKTTPRLIFQRRKLPYTVYHYRCSTPFVEFEIHSLYNKNCIGLLLYSENEINQIY